MSSGKNKSNRACAILVPANGKISGACEGALRQLESLNYSVYRVPGYSAVDQARNAIAASALANGCEETFWIDSDIGFSVQDVERIRSHDLPISCGIYVKKNNRSLACQLLPNTKEVVFGKNGGLMEILYAATGFLHVRRDVYDTIVKELELPKCGKRPDSFFPFFLPMVWTDEFGESTYLAEDFAFSHRAKLCGYRIFADTQIRLKHFGEYGFSWEDAGKPMTRYDTYRYKIL